MELSTATARPGTFEFANEDRKGFTASDRLGGRNCRVEERVCQRFSRRTPGRAPIKMESLTLIIVGVPLSKPTLSPCSDVNSRSSTAASGCISPLQQSKSLPATDNSSAPLL